MFLRWLGLLVLLEDENHLLIFRLVFPSVLVLKNHFHGKHHYLSIANFLLASSNFNSKTPLSIGSFYIKPQSYSCRPRDGTHLLLTKTTDWDKKEMEFVLSADGLLRHACSNTLVCPASSRNQANSLLVISRKCSNEQAKFERTQGVLSITNYSTISTLNHSHLQKPR